MTFEIEKNKQSSLKAYLVRIRPSRHINSYLTSIGGGKYSATIQLVISSIEENGVALTRVSTTPNVGEYLFDEANSALTIYPTNINNILIAHHYIFLTTTRFRVITEDPEDSNTTLRDWEPRLREGPRITQSIKNVIDGQLSISASNISIINGDQYFNQFLTDDDSFAQKEIKIWQYINNISNVKMVFQGTTGRNVSTNNDSVVISVTDILGELNKVALCGDSSDEVYYSSVTLANLNPDDEGEPNRLFFGRATIYSTLLTSITNLPQARALDPEQMTPAVCVDFTETISNTTNRQWLLGRVVSSYNFFDSPIVDNTDANFTRLTTTKEFFTGDTFIINQAATDYYARVYHFDRVNSYAYTNKIGAISTGATIVTNPAPSIVITDFDNNVYYPLYGRDYLATANTTSGGNSQIKITFQNNFEATLAMADLDPTAHTVVYRLRPNPMKHGDVVKYLLEKAGIPVNATSITSVNMALDVNASFSIPSWDESDFGLYYNYLENILATTLGHIRINESFEMEYALFDAPTTGPVRTDIDIIDGTFSSRIDYNEIATQIIAYNPHFNDVETLYQSSATADSPRARYLHGIDNVTRFVHCIDDISSRITAHINLKSERRGTYSISTVAVDMDTLLGDDLTIETDNLPGNAVQRNIKIVELEKTTGRTDIELIDLYNL